MLEGLPEGLARILWKGRPHSSFCRWASSSQEHRADSSRVVYDDVPYEKVQVSTTSWLIASQHSGAVAGLGWPCRCLSLLSLLPAGGGGAGPAGGSSGEAPRLVLQREVAAGGPASQSEETRVQ